MFLGIVIALRLSSTPGLTLHIHLIPLKRNFLLNSLPQLILGLAYGGETVNATPIITQTFIATLAPTEVYVHLRFHLMPNASRHACCSR